MTPKGSKTKSIIEEIQRNPARSGKEIAAAAGVDYRLLRSVACRYGLQYGQGKDRPACITDWRLSPENRAWVKDQAKAAKVPFQIMLNAIVTDARVECYSA